MGGKTSTSTQQLQIPAEVLQRYSQVNQGAETAAAKPFQSYSTDPNAFVAPLNETQQTGIAGANTYATAARPFYDAAAQQTWNAQGQAAPYNTYAAQNIAGAQDVGQATGRDAYTSVANAGSTANPLQYAAAGNYRQALAGAEPYQQTATGLAAAGAGAVNAGPLGAREINQYLSPYLQAVLGSTSALLNQNNQQQQAGQLGNAIRSGAFGGDRAGIAAANLAQQQNLGNASIYSGILNQGYGQALGTAQQQQGVGLGAAQANRAALAGAAGQLASIGQQGYSQRMGLGAAQQGLGGQFYDQAMGQGSAQAAIGEQLFGQGLGAAQAQASLGQQIFGQGQATAEQLANLGSGRQAAGLQGAQAQLAAGQVAQQTQQAGQTALYNQFLQQQSYPFQVAQFLANIAEGTGSLSGNTTVTQQPGGFFSDERLKDAIRPIGKTFDGQNIYSYRYKGDPRTQIGLMAQEVEKDHPDAVGLAHGYKTVDYREATDKAAKRGHFAGGGEVGYGFDPAVMAEILQNQTGMYGPYLTAAGGFPYGSSGRVPVGNLPVAEMKTAGPLPALPDGIGDLHEIIGAAKEAASDVDKLRHHGDKKGAANDNMRYGGLAAGRPHRAEGGLASHETPYTDQVGPMGLAIPDSRPDFERLQAAAKLNAPRSGLQEAGDAAGAIGDIAKLATMFLPLARGGVAGGRRGYAGGGAPDGDVLYTRRDGYDRGEFVDPDGNPVYAAAPGTRVAVGAPRLVGSGVVAAGNSIVMPREGATASWESPSPHGVTGSWDTASRSPLPTHDQMVALAAGAPVSVPAELRGLGASNRHAPRPVSRPALRVIPGGLAAAGPREIAVTPPTEAPMLDAVGAAPPADLHNDVPAANVRAPSTGLAARVAEGVGHGVERAGSGLGSLFHKINEGGTQSWIPLLAGIGAMGTAPTRSLGVALARGLEGYAAAYPKVQSQQAELAQTRATTGQTKATTEQTKTAAFKTFQDLAGPGYRWVPGVGTHGELYTGPDGQPYHRELLVGATDYNPAQPGAPGGVGTAPGAGPAATIPPGAPAAPAASVAHGPEVRSTFTPSADTDALMATNYKISPGQPGVANHERMLALNPALAPVDEAERKEAATRMAGQGDIDATHRQIMQLGAAINSLSPGGITGAGANFEDRLNLANVYATYASMMGVKPDPTVSKDLEAAQIIAKIRALSGSALANSYGQHAAAIAQSLSAVLPGGGLKKEAANDIIATMGIQNQQARDFGQYYNNYVARYGTAIGVQQAFQRDTGPVYDREQKILPAIMGSPAYGATLSALRSSNPEVQRRATELLDRYGPNFHRYFTGGQ